MEANPQKYCLAREFRVKTLNLTVDDLMTGNRFRARPHHYRRQDIHLIRGSPMAHTYRGHFVVILNVSILSLPPG